VKQFLHAAFATLLFAASAFAASVTGQVINGTSSKPSAGDTVTILSLSQGMQEIGTTKTDASGKFTADIPNDGTPHMLRVTHQGVDYFPKGGPLMPGATSAPAIQVYDSAKKLPVTTTVNVIRVQADNTTLQATELFAVQNSSSPAKTMFDSDHTYLFTLPEGAVLDSAAARTQDGQPVNTNAEQLKDKNTYAFDFPLRPGETQFQLSWHMPYKGEWSFTPKLLNEMQHYVVMFPKSMKFEAKKVSAYSPMNDDTGAGIQVASNVKPGDDLTFRISGTGEIAEAGQGGQGNPPEQAGAPMGPTAQTGRPGGGLGPPIEAPDPLEKYRWWILGILVVAMMLAALIVSKRNAPQTAVAAGVPMEDITAPPRMPQSIPAAAPGRSSLLLDAMKEELFQLELDKAEGRVTEAEYQKAKAALDETIRRAVTRRAKA
jgi:hypothetical protein